MISWGYIDRTAAYAAKLLLAPGIYRLTVQAYEKKSVDNINILSKYAYVSYDNTKKNTKIIFLSKNGTWQNQKGLCQAYTNIEYIDKAYHFCSADLYKQQINILDNQSFLWRDKNHRIGVYALVKPISYINSMYLAHPNHIYTEPNHLKDGLLVEAGTYIAILNKQPNWYEVETITSLGKRNHGWIDRDSFLISSFLPQKQETDLFQFLAGLYTETEDLDDVKVAIKVIDKKTGKVVQSLRNIDSEIGYHIQVLKNGKIVSKIDDKLPDLYNIVTVQDVNFDQYPDIRIANDSGGYKDNSTDSFFIYNHKTKHFDFNKELSDLLHVEVDTKNKIIKSLFAGDRGTAVLYSQEIYNFKNAKLHLIQSTEAHLITGDKIMTITKTLVNGKWTKNSVISGEK